MQESYLKFFKIIEEIKNNHEDKEENLRKI